MTRKVISEPNKYDQEIDDFKYANPEKQRYLIYSGKLSSVNRIIKYETEKKLCYFLETMTPRMGKVGFVQRTATEGFSFDKTKKKFSIWYGKKLARMNSFLIEEMMKDLGHDWYCSMSYQLKYVATRMLFEKIIKGNIKNPSEYTESYIKCHLKIKGIDSIKYAIIAESVEDIHRFNAILRCSDDPTTTVDNFSTKTGFWHNYNSSTVVRACNILGVKFNWTGTQAEMDHRLKDMEEKIRKIDKEYQLVQEFRGYTKPKLLESLNQQEANRQLPF